MELFASLQRLCCAAGPSGNIGAVADLAEEMLRPLVDELRRDRLNNVMGIRRCGKKNAKLVLLDAHLDEIGFIVTGHEDGFLRFSTLGGVDVRMLSGRELTLMTQPAGFGVVASKPPHVLSAAEREKAVALEHLRIDVGLTQEEARKRAEDALFQLGLEGFEERAPQYLSGGEKKRVTIAGVLAMEQAGRARSAPPTICTRTAPWRWMSPLPPSPMCPRTRGSRWAPARSSASVPIWLVG